MSDFAKNPYLLRLQTFFYNIFNTLFVTLTIVGRQRGREG